MNKTFLITVGKSGSMVLGSIASVLQRRIEERIVACGGSPAPLKPLSLHLESEGGTAADGYRIEDASNGGIRIVGDTDAGLLHGVGRFLREMRIAADGFQALAWRGRSVPEKPVRHIYFATHFHNYYHDAPIEVVQRYIEELGLWGYNGLTVWLDLHHYRSIDDPAAQTMVTRLRSLLATAKGIGMKVGMIAIANEAFADSPPELRAEGDLKGRGHYGVELCPSKPAAMSLLLRWHEQRLEAFKGIDMDYVVLWPYDQGGCACTHCEPWGANGYLRASQAVAALWRRYHPRIRVALSTWLFDYNGDQGEWRGLSRALEGGGGWLDYLMVDSHAEFPEHPRRQGVPGGLPMLNFPEISMRGMWPWGGFGANPQPAWFEHLWATSRDLVMGGFPYSEGIFEDINKVLYAQLYWKSDRKAMDILREYAASEYAPQVAEDVVRAIQLLEANHERNWSSGHYGKIVEPLRLAPDAGAAQALELLEHAERRLPTGVRQSWRWRILLLRALMDVELYRTGGIPGSVCETACQELKRLYWAERAESHVHPPTRHMRDQNQ